MRITGSLFVLFTVLIMACVKTEPVSPIPQITFKSLQTQFRVDTFNTLPVGVLIFDFIDGDADLGVIEAETDTLTDDDPARFSIFLTPYEKVDSSYLLVESDTGSPVQAYTIRHENRLDRVGQNRTIQGTITFLIEDMPERDTLRYEFHLRDRAGNVSNTEVTTNINSRRR